jgi:hypothetical protein
VRVEASACSGGVDHLDMDFRRAALALTANMSRLQHEPTRRGWPTTTRVRQNPRRTPGAAHESVSPQPCRALLDMHPSPLACPRMQPVSRACGATVDVCLAVWHIGSHIHLHYTNTWLGSLTTLQAQGSRFDPGIYRCFLRGTC